MKWFYRLLTLAMLGAAVTFPFFMKNQQGKPMFSLPEPKDLLPSVLTSSNTTSSLIPSSSQTFYKWQDENGTWHYGDTPPTNGPTFSTISVDSNTNIIQSIPLEKYEGKDTSFTNTPTNKQVEIPASNMLSFDQALNLIDDAKNVQGLMDNHNAQLEAISGGTRK